MFLDRATVLLLVDDLLHDLLLGDLILARLVLLQNVRDLSQLALLNLLLVLFQPGWERLEEVRNLERLLRNDHHLFSVERSAHSCLNLDGVVSNLQGLGNDADFLEISGVDLEVLEDLEHANEVSVLKLDGDVEGLDVLHELLSRLEVHVDLVVHLLQGPKLDFVLCQHLFFVVLDLFHFDIEVATCSRSLLGVNLAEIYCDLDELVLDLLVDLHLWPQTFQDLEDRRRFPLVGNSSLELVNLGPKCYQSL